MEEWEAWSKLPSQVHPFLVGTLSDPSDWTWACIESPSCQVLVRMGDQDQELKLPGTKLG